jgi:hypothetical protein
MDLFRSTRQQMTQLLLVTAVAVAGVVVADIGSG